MKTPEEIFDEIHRNAIGRPGNIKTVAVEAMKEFGRQAWIKCAFTFDAADDRATESISYNEWLQSLYADQHPQQPQND